LRVSNSLKNSIVFKGSVLERKYFAHSLKDKQTDQWHLLDKHLKSTAELAKSFADAFGAGEWAYLAGLWHDVGKYSNKKRRIKLHFV